MRDKTINKFRTDPNSFKGCWTALVTPFKKNGALDLEALKKLLERQISAHVSGVVLCGSTGEAATLSQEEFIQVLGEGVRYCRGRIPVMAGVASNDTAKAAALAVQAQKAGADALLVLSPYYNKPTQEGLYQHFKAVAGKVSSPIVIYNIPGRTAINILPLTLERLAQDCPNIIGVKESSGNLDQVSEIIRTLPDSFCVLSGDDSLTLPILSVGGVGAISVVSNLFPREVQALCQSFLRGDSQKARHLHSLLFSLTKALFVETNPIPVKAALWKIGLCSNSVRLPLTPLSKENLSVVEKELSAARSLFP
jgi:4-hydroxy-tetrahydrodipicolinate synthase